MSHPAQLLLVLLFAAAASGFPATSAASISPSTPQPKALNAYDVLMSYNFPKGLLPEGVLGYEIDPSTGKFSAYLNGSCEFSLEGSYQLKYKPTISGTITRNRITNLQGVSVKVLFFWVNIIEIVRDGDDLQFSVGIASADFPLSNFDVCPKCGCGVDCNTVTGSLRGRLGRLAAVNMRAPF